MIDGEFKKPDAVRDYLRDQFCQYCGESFQKMFSEEIREATKKITFIEGCFGEMIFKNNFVHYFSNIAFPTPVVS